MTTMITKRLGKMSVNLQPSANKPPSDDDFIRALNYDELEKKFHVRKYYPRFIHNYDYLTPQIKAMIVDKPIYARANKNAPQRTKRTVVTEIDVETGEMRVVSDATEGREQRRLQKRRDRETRKLERREQRSKHREERGRLRDQHRSERQSELDETRRLMRERSALLRKNEPTAERYTHAAIQPPAMAHARNILFHNPFAHDGLDLDQATLVVLQQHATGGARSRQNSAQPLEHPGRKLLISGRLKDMVISKLYDNKLTRTVSYDQTKSTMTSTRGAKNDMLRHNDSTGRRMSEKIGT